MIEKFLRKLSFFYEAVYCVRCSYLLAQVPISFEGKIGTLVIVIAAIP